ncbi:MAG: DNA mismatch repair protein MutS [Deltaproteobacteria bacterium]|nr:DNA mismatch repair protein MutS [Deltaproteobacteria bacterium]
MMKITPAMRQYLDVKERYKDCIIFFRMGDFYEMFFEDAVTASRVLEITLTSRNKGKKDSIPLCGVPHHAASTYISKLIDSGYKVAICEQVEDPKEAKGIVKREVVRIVTPGLVADSENLSAKKNNFLASFSLRDETFGLAFIDISTGEFRVTETDNREIFLNEIAGLEIKELLLAEELRGSSIVKAMSPEMNHCVVNYLSSSSFEYDRAIDLLKEYFDAKVIDDRDLEKHPAATEAAGAVLEYVKDTQREGFGHINGIEWHEIKGYLLLDDTAKKSLELFQTIQGGNKTGTLFHVLDETVTAPGARRLRWWLNYPLFDPEMIKERLAAVKEIKEQHILRKNLRELLSHVYDLERLGGRISMGIANGRDLVSLKTSLAMIPAIKDVIDGLESSKMLSICGGIDGMPDIKELIERSIVDEPPLTIGEGYVIKKGYNEELDSLVSLATDGKKWIAKLEEKERKRTGINTLKVGFNNVFGYYIEITKANAGLAPDDYVRKQTLVNAERYINEELKRYESTVLNAEERRKKLEYDLFVDIRGKIACEIERIQKTAFRLAELDALTALAEVAERYNYSCPKINEEDFIEIRDGRHPVVERMNLADGFVPNDTLLDTRNNRFLVITGPNMAGKSTYIRQVAIVVLMAQMGSFVPASEATIGLVDKLFTRVGAADNLARGQSTFMVEMTEVATILKSATQKSLILLDEVGRGTSTFDGLSIAWAVTEHISSSERLGARTLFATHYHELTDLSRTQEGVKNYSIAVKEWGEEIIFLRKIVEGGTNRSYGIQVARLAGVPDEVILRAREILENLERGELDEVGMPRIARGEMSAMRRGQEQLNLFMEDRDYVLRELGNLDILNVTPIDALQKISEWQTRIKGKK